LVAQTWQFAPARFALHAQLPRPSQVPPLLQVVAALQNLQFGNPK
jgi:hypothetical protein